MPESNLSEKPKIAIAGLMVDTARRETIAAEVKARLRENRKTFIVTPYSEFLYAALRDPAVLRLLNSADISIPDGIGIILARAFLVLPFSVKNRQLQWLQGWWQMFALGWLLLLWPKVVYGPFRHKIVGADFVWDLVQIAHDENKSVYILGGYGKTPAVAAEKLAARFPGLKIAGSSNKQKTDPTIIADIQAARPDVLLVGFGPLVQEKWIKDNWESLPVTVAIGLGGTFDYIAGAKAAPPAWVRRIGLEWLYRLVTQPSRALRIKRATFGLVNALINYKISL
jgi:N-acetylglucosaminyldiphosphoundecaprenol N-acetyl-beta-D-mannosaminyltransferase